MCLTLSLADEEKRPTEINDNTMDHQSDGSDALVCNSFSIYFQLDWKESG